MFLRTWLLLLVLFWSHPNKVIPFTALWLAWWQSKLSEEHWDVNKAYSLSRLFIDSYIHTYFPLGFLCCPNAWDHFFNASWRQEVFTRDLKAWICLACVHLLLAENEWQYSNIKLWHLPGKYTKTTWAKRQKTSYSNTFNSRSALLFHIQAL